MTKEEIIQKIKELKERGYTYKLIALEAGLEPDRIYAFMYRKGANLQTFQKLENYFMKKGDENNERA